VRNEDGAAAMKAIGAQPVWGELTNRQSLQEGMDSSDVVFHIAGWYKLGSSDAHKAYTINVEGTRNVLEVAHELGIPKIVYTSTIDVFGDTRGYMADESYRMPEGPFLTEYDRTKWLAHYKVALPLIEQGAPIIIVMPGVVYGPGDHSLIGEMMRYYYKGFFLMLPGPELGLTYAHVDDVAEGHILAAEKGKVGESYLITGPAMSLSEATKLWSQITGRREPLLHIPGRFLKPFGPIMARLGQVIPLPAILSQDAIAILEATYLARADKAAREIGWAPRSPEEGMAEYFDWLAQEPAGMDILQRLPEIGPARRRLIASVALGAAIGALIAWIVSRRRR
jgi:dihydroflavonol-4-reductase